MAERSSTCPRDRRLAKNSASPGADLLRKEADGETFMPFFGRRYRATSAAERESFGRKSPRWREDTIAEAPPNHRLPNLRARFNTMLAGVLCEG
jgi:hypothetical protein